MDRLKFISKNLYAKYGLNTKQKYEKYVITNIIKKKHCHIVACIKDSMIYDFVEEFLRRYYKKKELHNNMLKYVNYYKNYLRFFCKPTFTMQVLFMPAGRLEAKQSVPPWLLIFYRCWNR